MVELKLNVPESFWKEEERWGYRVTEETKRIWAVQLDLAQELQRVCHENGLRLFADSGTLLGAVRHQGYIPWDDDLDFIMTREDYDQLCKIAPRAFQPPYFFQTEDTDPGSIYLHAKLRNSATTGILASEYNERCHFNQGIFIDVFPFDNLPDDPQERSVFLARMDERRKQALNFSLFAYRPPKTNTFKRFVGNTFRKALKAISPRNPFYRRMEEEAKRYQKVSTKQFGAVTYPQIWFYDKDLFEKPEVVPFEFIKVLAPQHPEVILEGMYGDWKKPVMGGSLHGDVIFDVDKPYTDYLDRL